jgi:hypothetical protein
VNGTKSTGTENPTRLGTHNSLQGIAKGNREMELTPIPNAQPRYDENGNEVVDIVTCGVCGRSWNDAQVSQWTPVPSARCPFEYEHESESDTYADEIRAIVESFDYEMCYLCGQDLDRHFIGPDPLGHAHVYCMRPEE